MPNTTDDGFVEFEYLSSDGLMLRGKRYGSRDLQNRLPVICLAGLTRNSADFHKLAMSLSNHPKNPRQVLSLDYRGRGNSDHDKNWENYNPLVEAGDTIAAIEAAGFEDVSVIGTSRGGLIAMVLAAMRPGILKQVILNDIGPEIDGVGWARIKTTLQRMREPTSWAEAIELLHEGLGSQFTALSEQDWDDHAKATFRNENGKPVRNFDDGLLTSIKAQNLDQELPTFWPQFDGLLHLPLLVIRGGNSDLFSADTLDRMNERHPDMQSITVDGQGHAPMLHSGKLPAQIYKFLESTAPKH
jgi:pimeloyl-ACP methyl ester carboxylesterase